MVALTARHLRALPVPSAGAMGYESAAEISGRDIIRRTPEHGLRNFGETCPSVKLLHSRDLLGDCAPEELYPWTTLEPGSLIDRTAPTIMQVRLRLRLLSMPIA